MTSREVNLPAAGPVYGPRGQPAKGAALSRVVRQHAGQLAASLMHVTGDFAAAEDLVQDAALAALPLASARGPGRCR